MVSMDSFRLRRQSRWLTPAAIFVLSFVLHLGTLRGGFVWDDRLAVVGNRDIWTDSPWGDMWRHDFWGQEMTGAGSHKSFRPLTTLTFRLSNVVAQKMSAEEQGIVTASSEQATENRAAPAAKEELPTNRVDAVRGTGPRHADAIGFHLFNVIVHAATCSCSVWIFRAVFPGQELPAVVASLLFTVHPVHVEAVAPIVGRADLLCGLLSMIALSLTIATSGGQGGQTSSATSSDKAGETLLPGSAPELIGQDVAPVEAACFLSENSMALPTAAQGANINAVLRNEAGKEGYAMNQRAKGRGKTAHRKRKTGKPSSSLSVPTMTRSPPRTVGFLAVQAEKHDTGPGMVRFLGALVFAVGATLCKEIGITVFGLMAGGEVVRLLEEHDWQQWRQRRQQTGLDASTAAPREVLKNQVVLQPWWRRFEVRAPLAAVSRIASALTCAALLAALHVRLREGAGVREWGVLENDISILARRKERALSYAFTHAVYAYKLLWPTELCYDWGFSCIPHVTSLADPATIAPLALYGSGLVSAVLAVLHRDTAVVWGLALVVVPFLPASNVFFPVGAVVAERLLYLPSLGACVLAGSMLRRRGSIRNPDLTTPASGGEPNGVRSKKSANLNGDTNYMAVPCGDRVEHKQKEAGENRASPLSGNAKAATVTLGSPERERQQGSQTLPRGPVTTCSPCSSLSSATRAPARSCSSALLQVGKQDTKKAKRLPRVLGFRSALLPTRHTVIMAVLLSWAAFFGAGTLQRCKDWNSERALFESAIKVCPDGIKTLNNMAASMLNEEEAGRAEALLLRAVELHPGYGSAMFNLGASRMVLRDHIGAVTALERSLKLEPWNTMAMVYLGQVYIELALKALRTLSVGAGQRDSIEMEIDGMYQDTVIGPSSPESLLSTAELYTDQALTAGSGLPLARLVKGQALALRGKHQNAAEFFQSYIDISLHLLSGSGSSGSSSSNGNGIGVGGSLATSDAVDLASAYNLLGLALRDSGSDLIATKKAFLAGLSVAPDHLALLVNGGVAHQAAGDLSGAKTLYHRALFLQPNSPELLNNLGWLEEQSGGGSRASLETSARLYMRALELMHDRSPVRAQVELNLTNARKRLAENAGGKV